jgi:hypothetical protein
MSHMRVLLIWLGILEAEPRGSSLPAWVYTSLGVIGIVVGPGLGVSGEAAIGVVMAVLGAINVGLAIHKKGVDDRRRSDWSG